MKPPSNRGPQRGLTLPEACCTLAVVAILAVLALPAAQDLLAARRLEGLARQLATDLRLAQIEALARQESVRLSVLPAPGGTCYVVHTGPADACHCAADGPAWCGGRAQAIRTVQLASADRVGLASNVASILFDPQRGTASPTGTLSLTSPRERHLHAIVNILGRVRVCFPDAPVPGHRPC